MNKTVVAKYFDGQSSASKETTIVYNNTMKEFRLQMADGTSFIWILEDLTFEKYDNFLSIKNATFSGAILQVDDKDFTDNFYTAMKQNKGVDIHTRLLKLGLSKITAIAVCLFGLIVLAYFYVLPPMAEKSAELLPESFDNEIGNVFMETFLNDNEIDTVKTAYLEQFVAKLNLKNKKPLKITVIKSEQVNAFALPNGQIVVYSAILNKIESPEELVALLGHEASHVNSRHSTKMLCRNLAGYMVVSLLFSDVNGVMSVLLENAQQLHSLSYSRGFEQEADELGLTILIDNQVNPNGMVKLFDQLEKESKISIPEILSSHPLTSERKEHMQKIISKAVYDVKPNDQLATILEQIKN